jgi:thiamine kinase-like enzyme
VRVACTTEHGKKFMKTINRKNEQFVLLKYTKKLLYYDTMSGDYIAKVNRKMQVPHEDKILTSKEYLMGVGQEIKKLQALNPPSSFFKCIIETNIGDFHEKIPNHYLVLNQLLAKKYESDCICHNDLKIDNIVYEKTNNIVELIDFEFVGLGHHYWDLCMFFVDYFKHYDYSQKYFDHFALGFGEEIDMIMFIEVSFLVLITKIYRDSAIGEDVFFYQELLKNYYDMIKKMNTTDLTSSSIEVSNDDLTSDDTDVSKQQTNQEDSLLDYDDDDEVEAILLNYK